MLSSAHSSTQESMDHFMSPTGSGMGLRSFYVHPFTGASFREISEACLQPISHLVELVICGGAQPLGRARQRRRWKTHQNSHLHFVL